MRSGALTVHTENATVLSTALMIVVVLFPVSEVVLAVLKRATSTAAQVDD